jgi:hypothetical protein
MGDNIRMDLREIGLKKYIWLRVGTSVGLV